MRIYNRYILSLALLFSFINVVMAALGQKSLGANFTVLVIASLMVTLLFVFLSPKVSRALSAIALAFFAGSMAIMAIKAIDSLR